MEIDNYQNIKTELVKQQTVNQSQLKSMNSKDDDKLKTAISQFTSVFVKLMFKSMRSTLPEESYIDGGYAEEVFTDMMDEEVSKLGSKQSTFSNLNRLMFEQLNQDE
ncbi:MAG: rod-binding protein [Halanaerobiales bacterium]|nr:rod-binding protein [Halanaerobiales bacterium]